MPQIMNQRIVLRLFACLFFLSSCLVTKKKYNALLEEKYDLDSSVTRLQEDTARLNYLIKELTALNLELKKTVENRSMLFEDRTNSGRKLKKRTITDEEEHKNKAAYIYQFTKYIDFPAPHAHEYTIAVCLLCILK